MDWTSIFRASDDCDSLGSLRSMWLYSLISPAYPVVFFVSDYFRDGGGLLNVSAIAIISERYKGKERVQALVFSWFCRSCWDDVLPWSQPFWFAFGWQAAFLVLRISIPILLCISYLCLMDQRQKEWRKTPGCEDDGGTMGTTLGLAVVAAAIVLSMSWSPFPDSRVCEQIGHCPNCWGYISNRCWDLCRFGLLALDLPLPWSFVLVSGVTPLWPKCWSGSLQISWCLPLWQLLLASPTV